MPANYGITFCKTVLKRLREIEDEMFEKQNCGFVMGSQEYHTEIRMKRYLKRFQKEKELGLTPSYNPEIHGCLEE